MITNDEQHRKDCLNRHYENMNSMRAKAVMRNLNKKNTAIFIERINDAKGYRFING